MFKDKTLTFYCGLISGILGIATAVLYAIYANAVQHFNMLVFALILAGGLACALMIFTKFKFSMLISGFLFASAFGMYAWDRVIMFEEMINKIYGMSESGAILWVVLLIFALIIVCFASTVISAFSKEEK